jgi:hypothetical protein
MYISLYDLSNKKAGGQKTARKEVGGVFDRLALRGDFQRLGDRFAACAEEPAHDGIFDHATNLVRIKAEADHGIRQTVLVLVAQPMHETVIKQAVWSQHRLEPIEETFQSDYANVAHMLTPQQLPGPHFVYGLFTIATDHRVRNARELVKDIPK